MVYLPSSFKVDFPRILRGLRGQYIGLILLARPDSGFVHRAIGF